MKDQDVILEVTDWGLIMTIKQGFELNDANVFTSIQFVLDKLKKLGKHKIITDWTLATRKVSFINKYQAVEHFKMLTLFSEVYKIVFLVQKHDDLGNLKFVENVAHNHALFVRYFFDMASALKWILK
jgi:hypothetical protein